MPEKLQKLIDMFQMFDPADRTSMLLSYADQFKEVSPAVAQRPFPKSHQVPQCESDAYVWAIKALRPLVEKLGLVLPSLNFPHSG